MKARILASVAVCALTASMPAYAQVASDPEANAPRGLDVITVTAQRVEESSQSAPVALDVAVPEELFRHNVVRAEDLSRVSPALAALSTGGPLANFYLRGVGNATNNAYSDPAIAFNYDGVYIGRPSSTSGYFYDLNRVEILKGPQGTLYGRNATGGAINVIPNKPELGEYSGEFVASYGNYDWINSQGAVNLPLGDRFAMRLAGTVSRHDGFLSDDTGEQREYGARVQIYGELSEALTIRLAADMSHQGGNGASGAFIGAIDPSFGPMGFEEYVFTPSGFPLSQGEHDPISLAYLASRFSAQAGRAGATLASYPYNDNDYWGVTGEINWTTDAGTLTVQPAYRESHLDYQFTNSMHAGYTKEDDRQTSVEVRWAGDFGSVVDYLIGGMYFDENIDADALYNQFVLTPFQTFSTGTESWAGFGKVTLHATDQLSFTAAGRYTSDKKRFDGDSTVYLLFCGNPAPPQDFCPTVPFQPLVYSADELESFYGSMGVPVTPAPLYVLPGFVDGAPYVLRAPMSINSGLSNDKFTYRLAAQYDFSPESMAYASFETGYHAGGFSFARGVESYEPETIDAYTVGSKNRFFGSRLQVNLEAFLWKYKNQQYSQFGYDLGTPPTTVFLTRNIGNSTIKGVEADIDWLATPNTLLSANVQYLDAEYDSFVYYSPNQGLPPITSCDYAPTTQTTSAGVVSVFEVDCSGFPAFNSPKWSLNLNGQQVIPLGATKLTLQAGTRYRSASYPSPDYLPWARSDAAFVSNASITLSSNDESLFVTAYIYNIEDNRRLTGVTNTQLRIASAGTEQPRIYGIRIGGKF